MTKKIHEIKLRREYFKDVVEMRKTFEIRLNDRNYKVGDELFLMEYYNDRYTGNFVHRKVVYLIDLMELGISTEAYLVLGLERI